MSDDFQRANDKNLLKNVITTDEMWVYGYDVKPNNNPHTGRVLLHLTPRKHDRCTHE
jgi:hypothetical protein